MPPTEMRRSTLQRKDREELTTIATTLGRKPPSRARKGEIIDMIIDMANGEAAETAKPSSNDADRSAKEVDATEAAPDLSDTKDPDSEKVESDDSASGGTPAESRSKPKGSDRSTPAKSDRSRNRPNGSAKDAPQAQQQPQQSQQSQQSQQQQSDRTQGGSRRSRRRGRDRDPDPWDGEPVAVNGILDLRNEGFGFLRVNGYLPSKQDAYVPVKMVRELGLRKGDEITGASKPATRNEKNPALVSIETVNGGSPDSVAGRPRFEDLTPLFPDERLRQEIPRGQANVTARIIDLVSPIGKGQRGLIVSPPKAGKTMVMKNIIKSIETNNPEVHIIVLLVDERPEEVTDMKRSIKDGEVIASTFDRPAEEHTAVAEMTIERAKRIVESGRDVCIILDGITRLARAYNQAAPATGRVMSGGIDSGALYPPKKFFGAARNLEEGGSLTILASALVETGSRMDEVIFEEFKGTGNMELRLDRRAAERRIYPAINVAGSSTRHEELLFERKELDQVWKLRRVLMGISSEGDGGATSGLEMLIERIGSFRNNEAFLKEIAKGPSQG